MTCSLFMVTMTVICMVRPMVSPMMGTMMMAWAIGNNNCQQCGNNTKHLHDFLWDRAGVSDRLARVRRFSKYIVWPVGARLAMGENFKWSED